MNLPRCYHTSVRITGNGVAVSNLDAAVLVRNAFDKKYIAAFNVLGPTFPVNAVSVGEQRVRAVELHYQFRGCRDNLDDFAGDTHDARASPHRDRPTAR